MTKTLRVDLADLEGIPHASGPSGTSVVVTAEYTSPVILASDGTIILAPKSKTMGAAGRVDFDGIYASDSEDVREDHRGFAVRVKVAIREPNGATRTWSRTVKPLEFMTSTVRLGRMPSAEGLPPQWVSVDDFVDAVDAQLGAAVGNATAALEAAEDAQTSAAQAAADADEAATLAQQAQAAALEVPDANVSALIGNPATETRAALAKVLPDRRVEVASMPAWTGDPDDDQSAAFAQAAAVHAGPMVIGVPVGTWKAQGLVLRNGLFYVGQGQESSILALADSPTDHLFRSTETGEMNSGGVIAMTLLGRGGFHGEGRDEGRNGIDLTSYTRVWSFEVTDCLVKGFERGLNGAQGGGLGDDRYLSITNTRFWYCYVGVYGNEHPMFANVEVRQCFHGITGRLYDLTLMAGVKVNRCFYGIGGPADARCENTNAHIIGVSVYRCETGIVLGNYSSVRGCRFTGGHPSAGSRPPGSPATRDVVAEGSFIDITACRFGTAADQSDICVQVVTSSSSNHRHVNISNNYFLHGAGQSSEPVAAIDAPNGGAVVKVRSNYFALLSAGTGISSGAPTHIWDVSENHVYIGGTGRFMAASASTNSAAIDRNSIFCGGGGTLPAPIFDMSPSSSGTTFYRHNVMRTGAGTIGTLFSIDARSAHLEGNGVAANCTLVSWTNNNGVADVVYMGGNRGPGAESKSERITTTTIPNGQSSFTVTHGLAKAPLAVIATPINAQASVWVSSRNDTTFTINREGTSGALVVAYAAYTQNIF